MLRRPVLSLVLAAALLLALAAPSAAASARGPLALDLGSLWGQAWAWLTSLLPHADAGCDIDPDGARRCQASVTNPPLGPTLDRGCSIDPDGVPRCQASVTNLPPGPTLDRGCEIDPDGRCVH